MYGPLLILLFTLLFLCGASRAPAQETNVTESGHVRQVKLFDNVYMQVPEHGNGISFQITPDAEDGDTGRGKKKNLLQKFMPMFVMPFIIQSTIIPLFLGMIKFMLFKSLMIGKLALVLIILNAFRNHNSFKGRNDDASIANLHYGYTGSEMEKYGALLNQ